MKVNKKMMRLFLWSILSWSYASDFYVDFEWDISGSLLYLLGAAAGAYLFFTEERFFYDCISLFRKRNIYR